MRTLSTVLMAVVIVAGCGVSGESKRQQSGMLKVSPLNPAARPAVPPLPQTPMVNVAIEGDWQLDGLNCTGCRIRDARLRYWGGSFRCTECWLAGTVTVYYEGAAANAFSVSNWLPEVSKERKPRPTMLTITATEQAVKFDEARKVTLVSANATP